MWLTLMRKSLAKACRLQKALSLERIRSAVRPKPRQRTTRNPTPMVDLRPNLNPSAPWFQSSGGCGCPRRKSRLCCGALCLVLCLCSSSIAVAEEAPQAASQITESAPPDDQISPPSALKTVAAVYPSSVTVKSPEARVDLIVTVKRDGSIGEISIAHSTGPQFSAAAIEALGQWRFSPAMKAGVAIDSRVPVPFIFKPRAAEAAEPERTKEANSPPHPASPAQPVNESAKIQNLPAKAAQPETGNSGAPVVPEKVTVVGKKRESVQERAVSDFKITGDIISAAPRQEGAEALRSAPGMYIGRSKGPAVAHNYMLRGFDAEHGQDIEFKVAGLPINMPSHIHGQGYADLGFLIGDVISELNVTEGVSNPRQGDFAVAGTIDVRLGVDRESRGVKLQSGYGRYNSQKQLLRWAPRDAPKESFGAVQHMRTDGFGENRRGESASAIFQHRFGDGDVTYRSIGIAHAARANIAGVIRKDDLDAGDICFTCVYPYATAEGQNAQANRIMAGLFADYDAKDGGRGQAGLWLGYDNFRLQENFTGFIQQSQVLERVGGRGDLIEQQNQTTSIGVSGRYRTAPLKQGKSMTTTVEVGASGRMDTIDQAQNLLDAAVRNQTWDRRIDASIRAMDLGMWTEFDWKFKRIVRARIGVRGAMLSYDTEDRLGNFVPLTRPQDAFIPGFRRSTLGTAWGPRASLEVRPTKHFSLLAAYGEGYRSPQARLLEDSEPTPFARVRSVDFGVRYKRRKALKLNLGGYYTHLSDDVAFSASDSQLERIGATQRLGGVFHLVTRPNDWLVGSLSVTYVHATLLEQPPSSAEEPQPPFSEGQHLPFIPPLVVRADVGVKKPLSQTFGGQRLTLKSGIGFSYLSSRPLPFGDFAEPVTLLDVSGGITWGPLELMIEVFNALDAEYAAVEFSFPSDWNPNDGFRPRTPARHMSAGSPLGWMASLGVQL